MLGSWTSGKSIRKNLVENCVLDPFRGVNLHLW
jgi:hypothetical protein